MDKKKTMIILIVLIIVIILGFLFMINWKREILNPIEQLKKENTALTSKQLTTLNESLYQQLRELQVNTKNLVYYYGNYVLENNIYQGRFASQSGIMYEFTIHCDTLEVKVVEISKMQLAREALELDQSGFDPTER